MIFLLLRTCHALVAATSRGSYLLMVAANMLQHAWPPVPKGALRPCC